MPSSSASMQPLLCLSLLAVRRRYTQINSGKNCSVNLLSRTSELRYSSNSWWQTGSRSCGKARRLMTLLLGFSNKWEWNSKYRGYIIQLPLPVKKMLLDNKWMNKNDICIPLKKICKDRPKRHWYAVLGNVVLLQTLQSCALRTLVLSMRLNFAYMY